MTEYNAIKLGADNRIVEWKSLILFNIYRFTLSSLLASAFFLNHSPSFLGQFDEKLFSIIGILYLGLSLFYFFSTHLRWFDFNKQTVVHVLSDIFAISLLMHASGGVNSGLGMLLIIAIAGGSLLSEGRTAFFFAAVASLCVLIHVSIADIYSWFPTTNYSHAGMLGITFFTTAFLAYTLAKRAKTSEALAKQRGMHLQYLSELNAQIVQSIQSGIIVVDGAGRIRLFNDSAKKLLGLDEQPIGRTLMFVAPELATQMKKQQEGYSDNAQLFRPPTGEVDVVAKFTELRRVDSIGTLIVLEDATLLAERAQQLKLASLGRLTASIAHEIRNPLGAISHAGQLLAESHLSDSDKQLVKIISDQSQRMNIIIENVLQLSRRQPMYTQCFDLCAWLNSFAEEFVLQHDLKPEDIAVKIQDKSVFAYFDRIQLDQVVNNLCENGLRYSQGLPLLELSAGIHKESKRSYLSVRDHGTGIRRRVAAHIFEPFFTTEAKGIGLGLYIAREICAANKASLHLVENDKTGCCFRIHLMAGHPSEMTN
jgi:two-component system sensor histidine kinase PilS (NtrC family)